MLGLLRARAAELEQEIQEFETRRAEVLEDIVQVRELVAMAKMAKKDHLEQQGSP